MLLSPQGRKEVKRKASKFFSITSFLNRSVRFRIPPSDTHIRLAALNLCFPNKSCTVQCCFFYKEEK